ncbi:MAG: amidohydrolase family protein [Acidobacteriota bacterium]
MKHPARRRLSCRNLVWALLCVLVSIPVNGYAQEIIIRGGWLFDSVRDDVVHNSGIIISGGKFLEVGADLSGRDLSRTQVIDLGDDDYILPGIFDLHAHYNVNLFGRGRKDEYVVNPVIFLANGVTSTFPAGEYNPTAMLEARKRIDADKQIGPRIFNSGPYFGTARPGWKDEATAEEIYREVDFWAALGVKGFKAKGMRPQQLRALIARAHLHALTVTGHLGSGYQNTVNPKDAILMGIDRVEHFLGGDALPPDKPAYASLVNVEPNTPEFKKIVQMFIKHNVFFDATLSAYGYSGKRQEGFDHWVEERKFLTPYVQEFLKNRPAREVNTQFEKIYWVKRKTIRAFYQAGGLITLGTDHPSTGEYLSGFSTHRELHTLVLSGIPPAAAIKIATINGARALNVSHKLGSIEPGKFADLFVVTGNPLKDIRNTRNVRLVMKSGQVYDSKALLKSVEGNLGPNSPQEAEAW